jgi:glycosyltransferase involved in cell wall biosynthesis
MVRQPLLTPMMPRFSVISVVIPCFNASKTLRETIQSVLSQEGVEIDVLVIDDGSSDPSIDVLRRFGSAIRILTGPHRGASAARNRGIAEARGEWLVFLDSDDVLLPGTLKRRVDAANSSGADVIVCDWQDIVDFGDRTIDGPVKSLDMSTLEADAEIACATHAWVTTAALMYGCSIVDKIGGFRGDLPIIQDARFMFDAAYHGASFVRTPHIGARYRILQQSLSRRDPALFWRDVLLNGKQIEALWRSRGALSAMQLTALGDIYNGAAYGLFSARDPSFREALAACRGSHLSISRRNRLAEMMSDLAGQSSAVHMARLWTKSRRLLNNTSQPAQ